MVKVVVVADYRSLILKNKNKEKGENLVIELVPNPDILAALGERKHQFPGFAAETQDVVANAWKSCAVKMLICWWLMMLPNSRRLWKRYKYSQFLFKMEKNRLSADEQN